MPYNPKRHHRRSIRLPGYDYTQPGAYYITICTPQREQFGKPVPGSIPTVVRSFKSAVTHRINLMRRSPIPPIWQRNYHENIIRVEQDLERIRHYIINNPQQWASDDENPQSDPDYQQYSLDLYF